ncbi:MAG: ABC transporter permease [Thermoprotei archaeon]
MRISLIVTRRIKPLPRWTAPVLSFIIGTLLAIALLYVLTGGRADPLVILASIGRALASPNLLLKNFALLTIVGIGLLISFKAAVFNIGGEGQFYFAIIAATWVALYSGLGTILIINKLAMLILGIVLAGVWALIAAAPRGYLGVDEVPVTLLMNYIAYYIVDYLVFGPWREPVYKYARTSTIPVESWFIHIPGTTATIELLVLMVVVIIGAWYLLRNTRLGLMISVMGSNPHVLRVVGVRPEQIVVAALVISGMVIGFAGVSYLAGEAHLITIPAEERTPMLGYTGILVAWLSMLEIVYIPVAAYIVSALINAGINIQIAGAGGASVVDVFIGTILLMYSIFVILTEYRVRLVIK